jgi:hypothetical protein
MNKLTLRPGDRIVFHPGLKIENTTKNKTMVFEMGTSLDVTENNVELIDVKLVPSSKDLTDI